MAEAFYYEVMECMEIPGGRIDVECHELLIKEVKSYRNGLNNFFKDLNRLEEDN